MEKIKQRMIESFVGYGKRHRKLAALVIAALAVCLMFFYAIRGFCRKLCQSKFRRRLACMIMVVVVLFTQTDLYSVFALGPNNDMDVCTVFGFEELPSGIYQTVPVGTTLEELSFPDTINGYIMPDDGTSEEETDVSGGNAPGEGTDVSGGNAPEEGTDEPGGNAPEEGTDVSGGNATEEDTGATGGNVAGEDTGVTGGNVTGEDTGVIGGNDASESTDTPESTEASEKNFAEESGEKSGENNAEKIQVTTFGTADEVIEETVTVEMQEYYAAPDVQKVNVLNREYDAGSVYRTEAISVTWETTPAYDGNVKGEYVFTPVLPKRYVLAEGVSLPQLTVKVSDAADSEIMSVYNTAVAAFLALEGADTTKPDVLMQLLQEAFDTYDALDAERQELFISEHPDLFTLALDLQAKLEKMQKTRAMMQNEITDGDSWSGQTLSDTMTYNIPAGVTLTVMGEQIITGSITFTGGGTILCGYDGSGMFSVQGGSLTLDGVTLCSNDTYRNRAIYVQSGSVSMRNATIKNFNYQSNGAAAYVGGGTFTIESSSVINNSTNNYGGAFYVRGGGELTINGGTFSGNKTTSTSSSYGGGVIYNRDAKTIINGGTFTNNSSNRGGAVYNSSYGTLIINEGTFSGNMANEKDSSEYSYGNGIFHSARTSGVSAVLKIGSDANIKDEIYLDTSTSTGDKILEVTKPLLYPVMIVMSDTSAAEGRVIAEGRDYTLTEQDMSRISIRNTGWHFLLAENRILLTQTPVYFNVTVSGLPEGMTVKAGDTQLDFVGERTYGGQLKEGTYSVFADNVFYGELIVSAGGENRLDIQSHIHTLCDTTGCTDTNHNHREYLFTSLDNSSYQGGELPAGNYYLSEDIKINSPIFFGGDVNLCLNGYTIAADYSTSENSNYSRVISTSHSEGSCWNICDCSEQKTGKITGGSTNGGSIQVILHGKGTLSLYGGSLCDTGSSASSTVNGAGVTISGNSTFNMYGGSIRNNKTDGNGGGVYLSDSAGAFNFYGGTISGNLAKEGGGLYTIGSINMSGGVICNNTALSGGGIYIDANATDSGTFCLSGGAVTENICGASADGGGVYMCIGARFFLSGNPVVKDNKKEDNTSSNVFLFYNGSNREHAFITINGELKYDEPIGVSFANGGTGDFTDSTETAYNNANKFSGESKGYAVANNINSQQLTLAKQYTVAFDAAGGTVTLADKNICYGLTYGELPIPEKAGYIFDGWYTKASGGTEITSVTLVTQQSDHKIYAHWTAKSYTVTLNGNGGSGTTLSSYIYGIGKVLPTDWAKTDYIFEGWYASSNLTGTAVANISTSDIGNKEYWAKWKPVDYTITYTLGGGTASGNPDSYTIESGTITLNPPTRTGYTFDGWSGTGLSGSNNMTVTIPTGSTGNRVYTAHWTENTYCVTYHKSGGSIDDEAVYETYTYGTGIMLPVPTKESYEFDGWYDNAQCSGSKVTAISVSDIGNKEYWAKWKPFDYTITYTLEGGTASGNPDSYTVESGAITLNPPVRTGYTFAGWSGTGLSGSNNMTVTIPTGSTGNREYTAYWKDETAPVVSLTYSYVPKNLWQWLVGKESLVITAAITEEGSGAEHITCVMTPDSGVAETKTAVISDGKAEVTVAPDFAGTVVISCRDRAGNVSASVTVGKDLNGVGKLLIEDKAPQITFETESGLLTSEEYLKIPEITIKVTDDEDNIVFSGISSVTYRVGSGEVKTVECDYSASMLTEISFTIPASEISAGETEITVTATDNAGNICTVRGIIKVHVHRGTLIPEKTATCTGGGCQAYYICTCGKLFLYSDCTVEITDTAGIKTAALGHRFSEWDTMYPNCTDKGNRKRACTVCGYTEMENIEATGHSWETEYTVDKEATGMTEGSKSIHCAMCDAIKDSTVIPKVHVSVVDTAKESSAEQRLTEGNSEKTDEKNGQTDTQHAVEDMKQQQELNEQTIPAKINGQKLVVVDEKHVAGKVATGNIAKAEKTVLTVGDGVAIVTVVCEEEDCTAGVADTVGAVNAVLSPEQIQLIEDGKTIEVRVEVKDISDFVEDAEKQAVETGMAEYRQKLPGLCLGAYIDISMFVKIGEEDWSAVTRTSEPVEVVIGIPEELQKSDRSYYVIRLHEGETALLYDTDNVQDTITINTQLFSTYVIAYEQIDNEATGIPDVNEDRRCELCHICPTFLGVCCFVWLMLFAVAATAVIIIIRQKEKRNKLDA